MTDSELLAFFKENLPKFESEVWKEIDKRLEEIKFLMEERDKLINRVNDLEKKDQEFRNGKVGPFRKIRKQA